jgi:hypothetical protein
MDEETRREKELLLAMRNISAGKIGLTDEILEISHRIYDLFQAAGPSVSMKALANTFGRITVELLQKQMETENHTFDSLMDKVQHMSQRGNKNIPRYAYRILKLLRELEEEDTGWAASLSALGMVFMILGQNDNIYVGLSDESLAALARVEQGPEATSETAPE